MKRVIQLFWISLVFLLLFSGCVYDPGLPAHTMSPEQQRAASEAAQNAGAPDIMSELESAFAASAPRGCVLSDLVATVGAYRFEILPAGGTAYALAHRIAGATDAFDDMAAQLARFTDDVYAHLSGSPDDAGDVYVAVQNDQAPELALLVILNGSVLYDCRDELPDRAPGHEPAEYYVLNTSTKKIHNPWCPDVDRIDIKNRKASSAALHDLQLDGYTKCEQDGDWDLTEPTYLAAVTVGRSLDEIIEGGAAE